MSNKYRLIDEVKKAIILVLSEQRTAKDSYESVW